LDGDFNVRGVKNLRVVDASSWSEIPGYFPTSPTYMVSLAFIPRFDVVEFHHP
jgi:choline dehydrogenase